MKLFNIIIITENKLWEAIITPLYPMLDSFRKTVEREYRKEIYPISETKDFAKKYTSEVEEGLRRISR